MAPAGRCDHPRHRTRSVRIRCLWPRLAGTRPVAPGRGSALAGGTVAIRLATRGTGLYRALDLPAPAYQWSQGRHRGRYRDRGRDGRLGSGCYRFAQAHSPEPSRSGGEAGLSPAVVVVGILVTGILAAVIAGSVLTFADQVLSLSVAAFAAAVLAFAVTVLAVAIFAVAVFTLAVAVLAAAIFTVAALAVAVLAAAVLAAPIFTLAVLAAA